VRTSRRHLLVGAAASVALARGAAAAEPSDAQLIGRLLDRERELESAYATALAQGVIEPAVGERLLAHEREHVRALDKVLGGRRPAPIGFAPLPIRGPREFARAALGLEGATVTAYADALARLRNDRLLQPLGSIMACGAQHEVALRKLLDENLL
jgi:Ferritin-like domain